MIILVYIFYERLTLEVMGAPDKIPPMLLQSFLDVLK